MEPININLNFNVEVEFGDSAKNFLKAVLDYTEGRKEHNKPETVGEAAAVKPARKPKSEPKPVPAPAPAPDTDPIPTSVPASVPDEEPKSASTEHVTFEEARDLTMEVLQRDKTMAENLKALVAFYGGKALSDLKGDKLDCYYKKLKTIRDGQDS